MIDQTTIQTKSLMDLLKAMNEAIITNITITNRHLPKRPILRPLPETETVIDFLLKTSQWMIINWNTTMITNQMSWICFLIFQIRKSLKKDHLEEVSKKLANILFETYLYIVQHFHEFETKMYFRKLFRFRCGNFRSLWRRFSGIDYGQIQSITFGLWRRQSY